MTKTPSFEFNRFAAFVDDPNTRAFGDLSDERCERCGILRLRSGKQQLVVFPPGERQLPRIDIERATGRLVSRL